MWFSLNILYNSIFFYVNLYNILMLNRNAKTLKVYSARITTSKQLYFVNLLRISINKLLSNYSFCHE